MVFKVKPKAATPAALIKDGTYRATVSNLKQFANTYGERIGFEFTIKGGQFDGERVMRSTAPQLSKQSKLAEVIELPSHPFFVAVQFHPEFKSKPFAPHPLFEAFFGACN